jgi:hypothetical protein
MVDHICLWPDGRRKQARLPAIIKQAEAGLNRALVSKWGLQYDLQGQRQEQ